MCDDVCVTVCASVCVYVSVVLAFVVTNLINVMLLPPPPPPPLTALASARAALVLQALDFCQAPQKLQPVDTAPLSVSADVWCLCSILRPRLRTPTRFHSRSHFGLAFCMWLGGVCAGVSLDAEVESALGHCVCVCVWLSVVCVCVCHKYGAQLSKILCFCWRLAKSHWQHYPYWHNHRLAMALFVLGFWLLICLACGCFGS